MKTLNPIVTLATAAMLLSSSVYADGHDRGGYSRGGYNHGHNAPERHVRISNHSSGNWFVPLMIGSVLGYALSEPRRESVTYVTTPPPAQAVVYTAQPTYQEQWVYFSDCDCQRKVLVPVR